MNEKTSRRGANAGYSWHVVRPKDWEKRQTEARELLEGLVNLNERGATGVAIWLDCRREQISAWRHGKNIGAAYAALIKEEARKHHVKR
jgi:hypothetical protein